MEHARRLNVNIGELCDAMEDGSFENEYYLDLDSGEILLISEYGDDEEIQRLTEQVEEEPDRYEQVPKAESSEGYEDMLDFIVTVKDQHLVELLEVAVDGKGAFRRFKDVLLSYPTERERWFAFKNSRTEARALEWLDDIGVTPSEE